MKHVLAGTAAAPCNCSGDTNCMICDGGLALCVVCGGHEGAMSTDCPGRRLTSDELDHVYNGFLDFVDGAMLWKERQR